MGPVPNRFGIRGPGGGTESLGGGRIGDLSSAHDDPIHGCGGRARWPCGRTRDLWRASDALRSALTQLGLRRDRRSPPGFQPSCRCDPGRTALRSHSDGRSMASACSRGAEGPRDHYPGNGHHCGWCVGEEQISNSRLKYAGVSAVIQAQIFDYARSAPQANLLFAI